MTKLSNVKEKAKDFVERNGDAIKYGAYCGGCVIAGYTLGKYVTAVRVETGLRVLTIANPKLLDEMEIANEAATKVLNRVSKL